MPIKDAETLKTLFDKHLKQIYRYFFFRTQSRELAEDLTSQTFLKFVEQEKIIDIENSKSYLFGIAANTWFAYLRHKYQFQEISYNEEIAQQEIIADSFSNLDQRTELIKNLIAQLPEKQKHILWLRLIEKRTLKEICVNLDKDMNYVKTTQRRGIAGLKKLIQCTPIST